MSPWQIPPEVLDVSSCSSAGRPRRRGAKVVRPLHSALAVLLPQVSLLIAVPFLSALSQGFSGWPSTVAATQGRGSTKTRMMAQGTEVEDDAAMLRQLKEWKAKKQSSGSRGFGQKDTPAVKDTPPKEESPSVEEQPTPLPAEPSAAATGAAAAAKAAAEQSPAPAPAPRQPAPSPEKTFPKTANGAIEELLWRGQKYANPSELSPQQIIMVFFRFFANWRQREGIGGEVELNKKQKQIVILMIQSNLAYVKSGKDFWPTLCAELGAGRDPEVKDLVFALTGMYQ